MREARCDVLVIGGGVCGLWTLWSLLDAGYDAWLIEKNSLGDGQTIASQGILHAGAKYRLPGNAVDASRAVADVQDVWRAALAGERGGDGRGARAGVPDLAGVRLIDRRTVLWTMPTLGSRLAAKGAAGVLRSGVRKLGAGERPAVFGGAPVGVEVYETEECVLDPGSLMGELARACGGRVRWAQDVEKLRVSTAAGSGRVLWGGEEGYGLEARPTGGGSDGEGIEVGCSAVVLAAGEGNEDLIAALGGDRALMQRRPLHQIVAIGAPFELNGHCLQLSLDKPALTVTSGALVGERTWYLGGGPAEDGIGRMPDEQVEAGRAALARCLPWIDLSGLRFETFTIDRAEGQNGGKRPDDAVAVWAADRAVAVWPTKLVLAPRAASLVLERLRERGVRPSGVKENEALSSMPEPGVAARVW